MTLKFINSLLLSGLPLVSHGLVRPELSYVTLSSGRYCSKCGVSWNYSGTPWRFGRKVFLSVVLLQLQTVYFKSEDFEKCTVRYAKVRSVIQMRLFIVPFLPVNGGLIHLEAFRLSGSLRLLNMNTNAITKALVFVKQDQKF